MNFTTKQIAEITDSQLIGDENLCVKNISFDSRNIYSTANTAFLAINTQKNSGEKYILSAIEKGIKIIFYQEDIDGRQSRTFAEELGGRAEKISPMAINYVDNIRQMARSFAEGLK